MGLIGYKGVLYGGGSDVVANPQDTATDNLEKVSIDGTVYDVTDADAVHTSDIGTANGVAELDSNGKVPSSQLPSYVDDYVEGYYDSNTDRFYEESTFTTVIPPTDGKSWVDVLTNKSYRWTGSVYTRVDEGVQLGETSSTAYRGDRGKTAYDHATESGRSGAKSAGLYKIGVTAQGHIASTTAVAKSDLTALGLADQNDVDAIEEDIEGFKTVTGKYITVTDAAELPAKAYSLTLSPVQEGSGDPSPLNVRPIHGADEVGVRVCGKNLFDKSTSVAESRFNATGAISYLSDYSRSQFIRCKEGTTYYFKDVLSASNFSAVWWYDKDFVNVGYNAFSGDSDKASGTATAPSGAYYVGINFKESVKDTVCLYESGASDGEYFPYEEHSTTITLPSTVYGGSVEQGGSGEKTYNYAVFDGSNDEAWDIYQADGINQLYIPTADLKGYTINLYANEFKTISINDRTGNYGTIYASSTAICVNIANIASVADFRAWLSNNNLQVAYELATPETLSLTPFPQTLLEGVNNVWAEMKENSTVIDNAQQSLSYQPQNIVGELRQEIEAKPDSFAQLSDTSFSNLANGQIPKWNSTTSKWENANESGGGGTFTRISVQDVAGTAWVITPNNIASLTITASKEDLGLNNDDFYILEGVELVDWQDSSKKYPYVITKFVDDRENDSIAIYGFMIHNESSIRGVNHTFNFIVVS